MNKTMVRNNALLFCSLFVFSASFLYANSEYRIYLLSKVNDNIPVVDEAVNINSSQSCHLSVLIKMKTENGNIYFYSDYDGTATLNNTTIPVKKWTLEKPIKIRWYKIEPLMQHGGKGNDPTVPWFKWYTNAYTPESPKNRIWIGYDKIEYKSVLLYPEETLWKIKADAHPTGPEYDINDGLGVMRYQVEVEIDEKIYSTPGIKSIDQLGIKNDVFKIVIRKDDSYIGYITSFFNVPGIFGSTDGQSANYIGIDCADLVVGAYNKWKNRSLKYTNVNGLLKIMKKERKLLYVALDGKMFEDEKLMKPVEIKFKAGSAIAIDYPGTAKGAYDHVVILYNDADNNGIISLNDEILQCGPMELKKDILASQISDVTRLQLLNWQDE